MINGLYHTRRYQNAGFTEKVLRRKHELIDVLPITISGIEDEHGAHLIADLIKLSRIHRNHGEIMGAWKFMLQRLRLSEDTFGVLTHIKTHLVDHEDDQREPT